MLRSFGVLLSLALLSVGFPSRGAAQDPTREESPEETPAPSEDPLDDVAAEFPPEVVTAESPPDRVATESPPAVEAEAPPTEDVDVVAPDGSIELPPPRSGNPRVHWNDRWGRSGWPNYAMVGVTALDAVGNLIVAADEEHPDRGRNDFDESVRAALRAPSEQDRLIIRDVSDALLAGLTSWPILIDALVLAAWDLDSPDVAVQMILIHAEVIAFTLALQTTANVLLSRERPYGRTCGGGGPDDLPEVSGFCATPDRYYSYFSGHTSQSFASAAVSCSFHMNMPLLGTGSETLIPCIGGFALATLTGVLRIMGDMHYATDVITGALIGTTTGFLLPWLLHFRERDNGNVGDGSGDIRVTILPQPNGAAIFGVF